MPGAYAHIAIVNDAQKHTKTHKLRDETAAILGLYLKYVELGAVAPDYPYLALQKGQGMWADNMHYTNTATLLRAGVAAVRELPHPQRQRATAWLMGFAAHMTTDMTIHPVVEARVGPYIDNKGEHRKCEMHQDAFIFPRILGVGDTGLSEHLSTGIASCNSAADHDQLEETIYATWLAMLGAAYPAEVAIHAPDPSVWHCGFKDVLSVMAKANHLFPFARHAAAGLNIAYPKSDGVQDDYIFQLETPEGRMDYQEIFERARSNVLSVWSGIDFALLDGNSDFLDALEDWNLDNGRSQATQKHVFWKD
jgi:hypothetical protein